MNDKQTPTERQDARQRWSRLLGQPERLKLHAARVLNPTDYSIAADYHRRAQHILSLSARANKVAQLGQLVASVYCECEPRDAAACWKALTPEQQVAANAAVQAAIEEYVG